MTFNSHYSIRICLYIYLYVIQVTILRHNRFSIFDTFNGDRAVTRKRSDIRIIRTTYESNLLCSISTATG